MITLRAALAILLLFGVYLLVLVGIAIAGGFMVLTAAAVQSYIQGETTALGSQIVIGLAGSIAALIALIGAVFTVNAAGAYTSDSVRVNENEAPELWAFVRVVAAEAGVQAPDELRLTGEVNASVSEDSRLLGLLPGRRCLNLGLPLLAELSANELRALLGHEFGHYLGWHTRFSGLVYRGYLALDRIVENLAEVDFRQGPTSLIRGFFSLYATLYARVSFAVRRRQEFEADAVAARLAGPAATARALRSLAAIHLSWQVYRQNYLLRTAIAGYAPEDPLAMFVAMLADQQRRKVLEQLKSEDPEPEKRQWHASHPSMADRLARLADTHADVPARLSEPVPSTWVYPKRALLRHLVPMHKVKTLPNAQWLDRAARLAAPTASARMLLDAAGPEATLDTVLDALEAGEANRLAERFDAEDQHRAMARLCEALHGLAGHYLVEAGSAHWRLSWTGPSALVVSELRSDGVHVLPFAELNSLVFDAVDHRSGVDRLRLHLASLRVNPQRAYVSAAERTMSVVVDDEPMRQEQARRKRVMVYGGVIAVAVAGVFVVAELTPKPPPPGFTTSVPTFRQPATTFPFLPTGQVVPSLLAPTLPSFDFTVTGPITVAPGDTLEELARCHLTTVADLQQINNLGAATGIRVGQTLLVPNVFLACR